MAKIGLIGVGVMGRNLLRNLVRNEVSVIGYDRDVVRVAEFDQIENSPLASATSDLGVFLAALEKPRIIWLMVNAGKPVDSVLADLKRYLQAGDVVIDGGNSHFKDTERRMAELAGVGVRFVGMGISGGAAGALWGPSLMFGGSPEAYAGLEEILVKVAARAEDGSACVAHFGPGGAGHYVKMVHNGIEYAQMQAIAEAYDLLARVEGLNAPELATVFKGWNTGESASFLVENVGRIFGVTDTLTGHALVEQVLDQARQKGTGQWTSAEALELGVSLNVITSAVDARVISGLREQRKASANILPGPLPGSSTPPAGLVKAARAGLLGVEITAFAQGFALLAAASERYGYDIPLNEVARVWRAGCIIRSALLEPIYTALTVGRITNLLIAPVLRGILGDCAADWRKALEAGISAGIPLPTMSAGLAYYDAYRSARLPANLIQAMRDDFGAHTFERIDRAGSFHSEWDKNS